MNQKSEDQKLKNQKPDSQKSEDQESKKAKNRRKKVWIYYLICWLIAVGAWYLTLRINSEIIIKDYRNWFALVSLVGAFALGAYSLRHWLYKENKTAEQPEGKRKSRREEKERRFKKRMIHTLALPSGVVRGFLIIILILVAISYVIFNMDIPLHFLIALNIILLYYEIKPEEVLPKKFVVEIPEKYGTIDRIPRVSKTIDNIEKKLKIIKEESDQLLDGWIEKLNKAKDLMSNEAEKAQNLIKAVKKEVEESEDLELLKKNMKSFYNFVDNFTVKGKTILEQIGLMFLLLSIGFFSIWYIETSEDPFNAITIALSAFLAAVAIAFGLNLQEILVKFMEKPLNDAFDTVKKGINSFKREFDKCVDEVKEATKTVGAYKDKVIKEIEAVLNTFRQSNILMIFPKDIVACISINFVAYLCAIAMYMPVVYLTEFVLVGIEFVIGYYFMTKK